MKLTKQNMKGALEFLQHEFRNYYVEPTGSVIINGEGEDVDILIYNRFNNPGFHLRELGFIQQRHAYENADVTSFKKGRVNVLVPHSHDAFHKWLTATNVCRLISDGKMPKPVRVAIFKLIREECSLAEMHEFIMERYGSYNDVPDVAPVDEVELRPAVPAPIKPVEEVDGD